MFSRLTIFVVLLIMNRFRMKVAFEQVVWPMLVICIVSVVSAKEFSFAVFNYMSVRV